MLRCGDAGNRAMISSRRSISRCISGDRATMPIDGLDLDNGVASNGYAGERETYAGEREAYAGERERYAGERGAWEAVGHAQLEPSRESRRTG